MQTASRLPGLMLFSSTPLSGGTALADHLPKVSIYQSSTCDCCDEWISHLREEGFAVETIQVRDLDIVRSMSGLLPEQVSCHTARAEDYVIEGPVLADDIRRLLAERPAARGLMIPEPASDDESAESTLSERYQVLLIDNAGQAEVFADY